MPNFKDESHCAVLITSLVMFPFLATLSPSQSASTTGDAIVIGTKWRYLTYTDNYIFKSNTNLIFEAPQIAGWIFDHIEVDFGCEVGGVTGSNVSNIFTIDNGRIQECRVG